MKNVSADVVNVHLFGVTGQKKKHLKHHFSEKNLNIKNIVENNEIKEMRAVDSESRTRIFQYFRASFRKTETVLKFLKLSDGLYVSDGFVNVMCTW